MRKLFFVYGTLMSGYGNNQIITRSSSSVYLGPAITVDNFLLTTVGFPYMVPEARSGLRHHMVDPVLGEVWEINDPAVEASMDALEGIRYQHYQREVISVRIAGDAISVNTYIPHESNDTDDLLLCRKIPHPFDETKEVFQWSRY